MVIGLLHSCLYYFSIGCGVCGSEVSCWSSVGVLYNTLKVIFTWLIRSNSIGFVPIIYVAIVVLLYLVLPGFDMLLIIFCENLRTNVPIECYNLVLL